MPKLSAPSRDQRRRALLEAGWHCLATQAFRHLTIDEICAEAGASKGAFYGYFDHKQTFLLALLEDDAAALDVLMDELEATQASAIHRLRRFAAAMLAQAQDPGRLQVKADLWAEMLTQPDVRTRLAGATAVRRARLRTWVEHGIAEGALVATPANALASLLLALGDGLSLHAGLDQQAFQWANIRRAVDLLLSGISVP
ncbi:MAG TPA: TetR/AcrR family transcriptional regulator [Candidatus Micrarchaeia archaeon]|nr:TetR/AcrR family transcriptional regulator [Candidatus Micrarchaeia archaeon]